MSKLICQLLVRNIVNSQFTEVLGGVLDWADKIIIVDDGSTDNSAQFCTQFSPKTTVFTSPFGEAMFREDEAAMRNYLWSQTRQIGAEGDWIVSLDADEIFSPNFKDWARSFMLSNPEQEYVTFQLYDMWTPTHYRADGYWSNLTTKLFRYHDLDGGFLDKVHCSSVPKFVWNTRKELVNREVHIKHLGWIDNEGKQKKYDLYTKIASGANLEHAYTIKQPPTLKEYSVTKSDLNGLK